MHAVISNPPSSKNYGVTSQSSAFTKPTARQASDQTNPEPGIHNQEQSTRHQAPNTTKETIMNTRTFTRIFTSLFAFAMLLAMSVVQGAIWDGDTSANWSDAGNWDVPPVNGNSLTFPADALNKTNANDAGITSINLLTLGDAGWNIDLGGTVSMTAINATGSSQLTGNVTFANGSPRTVTLSGSNTTLEITGALTLSRANNSLNLQVNGTGNTLLVGSLYMGDGSGNKTISGTANVTVTGAVTEGMTNTTAFVKADTGTLTLNGTYTSNSLTTVNGGTMVINGDASGATGAFTVSNSGTTLGGTGSIGGILTSVTMNAGTALAPGNSAGSLEVGGTLTFADNTNDLIIEIGGTDFTLNGTEDYDRVKVTGLTTLNGATLDWSFIDGFTPSGGDMFGIVDAVGGLGGTFAGLAEGAELWNQDNTSLYITYAGLVDDSSVALTGGNDIVLYAVTIPEPSTMILAGLGLMGVCFRRRRSA
ncbi:MAG: PEP-CTERM sorting domain-containing protein [Lentisphaeria bacterium]|nr:PEP-CTERM sorting domain-containing protein [Lentisphaeria bacterium]